MVSLIRKKKINALYKREKKSGPLDWGRQTRAGTENQQNRKINKLGLPSQRCYTTYTTNVVILPTTKVLKAL